MIFKIFNLVYFLGGRPPGPGLDPPGPIPPPIAFVSIASILNVCVVVPVSIEYVFPIVNSGMLITTD